MSEPTPVCTCGKPVEWIDIYCQECWEAECSRTWWEMIARLTPNNLPPTKTNASTN